MREKEGGRGGRGRRQSHVPISIRFTRETLSIRLAVSEGRRIYRPCISVSHRINPNNRSLRFLNLNYCCPSVGTPEDKVSEFVLGIIDRRARRIAYPDSSQDCLPVRGLTATRRRTRAQLRFGRDLLLLFHFRSFVLVASRRFRRFEEKNEEGAGGEGRVPSRAATLAATRRSEEGWRN